MEYWSVGVMEYWEELGILKEARISFTQHSSTPILHHSNTPGLSPTPSLHFFSFAL
jgi:hypothetical protein